jgi:hypothetical protein
MEQARVSPIVKAIAVVAGVAAVAGLAWYLSRPSPASQARADASRLALSASPSAGSSAAKPPKAIDKVTKLAADQRKQLAERIENARAARAGAAATSAPPRPRLPDGSGEDTGTAITKTEIREAMRELIPYITECYEAALPTLPTKNFKMTAELTLTGDPDVGTIVDAKALADSEGKPLERTLDDCFRSNFMRMGLPPLAEGDTLEVRYPFEFREI